MINNENPYSKFLITAYLFTTYCYANHENTTDLHISNVKSQSELLGVHLFLLVTKSKSGTQEQIMF